MLNTLQLKNKNMKCRFPSGKKIYVLISFSLVSLLGISLANATIVTIQAVGSTPSTEAFVPSTANAVCGDTIKWVLVSGTHTTASTTIPNGAAAWSSPNITASGFTYVVTKAGTYNYTCHPATGGHMPASIVVTCTNGIPSIDPNYLSSVYPNPFCNKVTIETPDAEMIFIYNLVGEKVKSVMLNNKQTKTEIDVEELNKGFYFYSIIKEGEIIETRKIVKN